MVQTIRGLKKPYSKATYSRIFLRALLLLVLLLYFPIPYNLARFCNLNKIYINVQKLDFFELHSFLMGGKSIHFEQCPFNLFVAIAYYFTLKLFALFVNLAWVIGHKISLYSN